PGGRARAGRGGRGSAPAALGRLPTHAGPVRVVAGPVGAVARPVGVCPRKRRMAPAPAGAVTASAAGWDRRWTSGLGAGIFFKELSKLRFFLFAIDGGLNTLCPYRLKFSSGRN